eukprot:COSAG01_NODE_8725_length_2681_cov_35.567626_3_plen_77_part_00
MQQSLTSQILEPGARVETLNLCINPNTGLQLLTEYIQGGGEASNVFIQPGASSAALVDCCEAAGMTVHQGCVLVEM